MSALPYDAYRDSGVEWLGEIPAHWEVLRLKRIGEAITGLTYSPDDILASSEEGTLVLRSSNVQNGQIALEDCVYVACDIPDKLRARAEDILICSRNGSRALIGKNALIGPSLAGQTWGAFMTVFRTQDAPFLYWVMNSPIFSYQAATFLTSTINQLTIGDLNNFEVPIPPPSERVTIAAFLDEETRKIDKLMDAQRRLMDLQAERIASIAMANIGADWKRLGSLVEVIDRPVALEEGELYTRIGLYNRGRGLFHKEPTLGCDMGDSQFFWIESGDLILSGQFAWEGAVALAGESETGAVVSHRYPVLRGREGAMCTEAIFAILTSQYGNHILRENSRGAAGRNRPLNLRSLLKEPVPVLTSASQEMVTEAVRGRAEAARHMNRLEALLRERRAALISAAVTGKIDLRSFVPEQAEAA